MTYRSFDTETWKDPWFEELKPEAKLLFIYLWTNDVVNQAGMYQITKRRVEFETGLKIDDIIPDLSAKVAWDKEQNIVWVKNFCKRQCANPKFFKGAIRCVIDKDTIPIDLQKRFVDYNTNLFNKFKMEKPSFPDDTVSKGYQEGIDTLSSENSTGNEGINRDAVPTECKENTSKHPVSDKGTDVSVNIGVDAVLDTVSKGYQEGMDTHPLSGTGSDTGSGTGTEKDIGTSVPTPTHDDPPSSNNICPQNKIVDLYHDTLPEFPVVKVWSEKNQSFLRARWKSDKEYQSLKWWEDFFLRVRTSDFLMGKTKKPFFPDLEWLVTAGNFTKILNGRYDNRGGNGLAARGIVSEKTEQSVANLQAWMREEEANERQTAIQ